MRVGWVRTRVSINQRHQCSSYRLILDETEGAKNHQMSAQTVFIRITRFVMLLRLPKSPIYPFSRSLDETRNPPKTYARNDCGSDVLQKGRRL